MKKGFTLVELVATITILAIILGLVAVNATYFSDKRRQKDYENVVKIIEKSTDTYIYTDTDAYKKVNEKLTDSSAVCKINYQILVDNKLVDKDTINPKTKELIDTNSYVKVSIQLDDFKYEFIDKALVNTDEIIQDCLN